MRFGFFRVFQISLLGLGLHSHSNTGPCEMRPPNVFCSFVSEGRIRRHRAVGFRDCEINMAIGRYAIRCTPSHPTPTSRRCSFGCRSALPTPTEPKSRNTAAATTTTAKKNATRSSAAWRRHRRRNRLVPSSSAGRGTRPRRPSTNACRASVAESCRSTCVRPMSPRCRSRSPFSCSARTERSTGASAGALSTTEISRTQGRSTAP
mmetsp:Transcript_120902/g.347321  ORF Transcript_120902/g.347321 Transcript_120902/m.347321 type:complete len:206 (-) Transcript_120902:777-1394(-)